MKMNRLERELRGIYRDRENGWLFGVCAGLAERFSIDVNMLRLIVGVSALLFTLPTVLAYALAAMLLRDRPLLPRDPNHEKDFWRTDRRNGGY